MQEIIREPESREEFLAIDRMDDEQIAQEMRGGLIRGKYAYSFKARGDTVVGLSALGIQRIAQNYGGIEVARDYLDEDEDYYKCICQARDKIKDITMLGAAEQSKNMKGSRDTFALAKCVRKAQRNALRGILPVELLEQLLKIYIAGKADEERETKIASIKTRVREFGYNEDKFNAYLANEFNANELSALTVSQLTQVMRYIISSKAKHDLS